jgi:hypothetical protein
LGIKVVRAPVITTTSPISVVNGTNSTTITGTDPDSDSITWSLEAGTGDTDNGSFAINSSTGQLSLVSGNFNYGTKSSYSVRVQASDGIGYEQKSLTINVSAGGGEDNIVILSNIATISEWNSFVGNSTAQNYNLLSDLIFNSSFAGNLMIKSGKTFNGYNNTIFLNNLSSFNGLFNLHSGNITTTIKDLNVVISNVVLNSNKGFLVDGYSDNSIVSNGIIQNVKLVFNNSTMNNNCGGFIGSSGKNLTIQESYVQGNIQGTNSGGLVGNSCSNVNIYSSYVINMDKYQIITLNSLSGGLVGNASTITNIVDSYFVGPTTTNNGIKLSGTNIINQVNTYTANLDL